MREDAALVEQTLHATSESRNRRLATGLRQCAPARQNRDIPFATPPDYQNRLWLSTEIPTSPRRAPFRFQRASIGDWEKRGPEHRSKSRSDHGLRSAERSALAARLAPGTTRQMTSDDRWQRGLAWLGEGLAQGIASLLKARNVYRRHTLEARKRESPLSDEFGAASRPLRTAQRRSWGAHGLDVCGLPAPRAIVDGARGNGVPESAD